MSGKILNAVLLLLLVCGAVSDLRTRRIPRAVSYGALSCACMILLLRDGPLPAAFFALAVFLSGGKLRLLPYLLLLTVFGEAEERLMFFPAALLLTDLLFCAGVIGGGDAQLIFAMIGSCRGDPLFCAAAAGATIVSALIILARKGGTDSARLREAGANLARGTVREDRERLLMPYAALFPLIYGTYLFANHSF